MLTSEEFSCSFIAVLIVFNPHDIVNLQYNNGPIKF